MLYNDVVDRTCTVDSLGKEVRRSAGPVGRGVLRAALGRLLAWAAPLGRLLAWAAPLGRLLAWAAPLGRLLAWAAPLGRPLDWARTDGGLPRGRAHGPSAAGPPLFPSLQARTD